MSKSQVIFLLVVVIATFSVFFAYTNLKPQGGFQPNLGAPTTVQNQNGKTITLPFSINDPSVDTSPIIYTFDTTVRTVEQSPKGAEILTTITNPDVPQFIVGPKIPIYYSSAGKFQLATANNIRQGEDVKIRMSYGLKTKTWKLLRVDIIVTAFPSPVQSAPSTPVSTSTPTITPK